MKPTTEKYYWLEGYHYVKNLLSWMFCSINISDTFYCLGLEKMFTCLFAKIRSGAPSKSSCRRTFSANQIKVKIASESNVDHNEETPEQLQKKT